MARRSTAPSCRGQGRFQHASAIPVLTSIMSACRERPAKCSGQQPVSSAVVLSVGGTRHGRVGGWLSWRYSPSTGLAAANAARRRARQAAGHRVRAMAETGLDEGSGGNAAAGRMLRRQAQFGAECDRSTLKRVKKAGRRSLLAASSYRCGPTRKLRTSGAVACMGPRICVAGFAGESANVESGL